MSIELIDVTLRDGLQMESRVLSLEEKKQIYQAVIRCGVSRVEITSFVHPKRIPQFSDAEDFVKSLEIAAPAIEWMAFVPNLQGLHRLLGTPIQWASAFVSVSETFNRRNVNRSIEETLRELEAMRDVASRSGRKFRIYVSTLFGCPYEGLVSADNVFTVFQKVKALEPDEVALSDTLGTVTISRIREIFSMAFSLFKKDRISIHAHDTYGAGLTFVSLAYEAGIRRFDVSLGGIGGCPYAKFASGNVALEDVALLFIRQGEDFKKYWPEIIAGLEKIESLNILLHSKVSSILRRGGTPYGI